MTAIVAVIWIHYAATELSSFTGESMARWQTHLWLRQSLFDPVEGLAVVSVTA